MALSRGALQRMMNDGAGGEHPILKIDSVKPLGSSGQQQRFRLSVSDGESTQQAMLATQLNHLVSNNEIGVGTLIKADEWITNVVKDRKILILLQLECMGSSSASAAAPTPPVQQQQQQYQPPPVAAPAPAPFQQRQSRPVGSMSASSPSSSSNQNSQPISSLNPYQNRWTIKARVTTKGDIRRWSNSRGEGHLFSIDLLDKDGGEIRGTFFKEVADRFFDMIVEGQVYFISGGKLKVANKRYSTCNNDYEITFDQNTQMNHAGSDSTIQSVNFNFVQDISQIEQKEPNDLVDLVAFVKSFDDFSEFTSKAGNQCVKRDLTLVDDSNTEIRLTVWGDKARADPAQWQGNPIFAWKGAKVGDYGGRTLSMGAGSCMVKGDEVEDQTKVRALRSWFDGNGGNFNGTSSLSGMGGGGSRAIGALPERKVLSHIRDGGLGHGEKPDFVHCSGTVTFIRHDKTPYYTACLSSNCNKKVSTMVDGTFYCEKCEKSTQTCEHRYVLSCALQDHTGSQWISLFNDQAEQLLGIKADALAEMLGENGLDGDMAPPAYEEVFTRANFQQLAATVRCKHESYNDGESRLKVAVQRMKVIDFAEESRSLIEAIPK